MKTLLFIIKLIATFLFALIRFTFKGYIGWIGLILILLKILSIINWSWWIILLPLEYGTIYCLYMTIDGFLFQLGLKDAGTYALNTSGLSIEESRNIQISGIIINGPAHIGKVIDRLCKKPSRLEFNQALLDASLKLYSLHELAAFGGEDVGNIIKSDDTIIKWRKSGLNIPQD